MKNTNVSIFEGTPLEDVINFSGPFYELPDEISGFFFEKGIDVLNDREKAFLTICMEKNYRKEELISKILGINSCEVAHVSDKYLYDVVLKDRATPAQFNEIWKLYNNTVFLSDTMWALVRNRIPNDKILTYMGLLPGYVISTGLGWKPQIDRYLAQTFMGVAICAH